jgi:hypothetical protein
MCVAAESLGVIIDVLNIFNVMTACGNNLSHRCIGYYLSVKHSPDIKWSSNDLTPRSAEFHVWMYGRTN